MVYTYMSITLLLCNKDYNVVGVIPGCGRDLSSRL